MLEIVGGWKVDETSCHRYKVVAQTSIFNREFPENERVNNLVPKIIFADEGGMQCQQFHINI